MRLIFDNVKLCSGEPNPQRWESECRTYSIQRFTYHKRGGYCPPYFAGYRRGDGMRITDGSNKLSFKDVTKALQKFEGTCHE